MKKSGRPTVHTTIIKRSAKKNHGGHHGGAWKVAFADFTLAMMALFMVLWILSSVNQKEREEIVAALHDQSIFKGNVFAPLNSIGKTNSVIPQQVPVTYKEPQKTRQVEKPKPTQVKPEEKPPVNVRQQEVDAAEKMDALSSKKSARELSELATNINSIAKKNHMEANLEIEVIPQGLRVLIQDGHDRDMFQRGSASLTPFFRTLLTELAPTFNNIDNKIIISGHTDAVMYKNQAKYNNWNLSGDRALVARRVLEQAGLAKGKVLQVNAMSDQMLLDPKSPESARNRRIEIMVLTKTASDSLYEFFGDRGDKVVEPLTEKIEKQEGLAASTTAPAE
ncbi:putative lateral flagellar export/assembly protein LafU [Ewingella americana]|uniref:putative lateral flagellar export/assembly protein LafU n=1 Tax=Ewingella americana TaxID=41202 RepID=UPI0012AE0D33|nr:putative lateral flagellar export/assembly protein LafU [Ewingella americana]MRT04184.1 putative lateral flagellar export/assembly protein LafU [Ewingella americana]